MPPVKELRQPQRHNWLRSDYEVLVGIHPSDPLHLPLADTNASSSAALGCTQKGSEPAWTADRSQQTPQCVQFVQSAMRRAVEAGGFVNRQE